MVWGLRVGVRGLDFDGWSSGFGVWGMGCVQGFRLFRKHDGGRNRDTDLKARVGSIRQSRPDSGLDLSHVSGETL